jgi:hypothetical protein
MTCSIAPAFAVSINGSISFSDGFNLPSLGQTTSIVSQLNNVDVLNGAGITLANGCTGSFGMCTSVLVANGGASDFAIGTAPVLVSNTTASNLQLQVLTQWNAEFCNAIKMVA